MQLLAADHYVLLASCSVDRRRVTFHLRLRRPSWRSDAILDIRHRVQPLVVAARGRYDMWRWIYATSESDMPDSTERFRFRCAACKEQFTKEERPPNSRIHVFLTAATLGAWLLIWAIWQWLWLYRLSSCPACGRGSLKLLITFAILVVITVDVLGSYYYLMYIVPDQIVLRSANPEPLSPREQAVAFLSVAATQYGPFVLLGWFVFFSAVLLCLPYRYRIAGPRG